MANAALTSSHLLRQVDSGRWHISHISIKHRSKHGQIDPLLSWLSWQSSSSQSSFQTWRCEAVAASEEGGDKLMSHLRQPQAPRKGPKRERKRRATSARQHVHKQPNPTPQPETPEPTAQKHEAVAASGEGGDDGDKLMSHLRQPDTPRKGRGRATSARQHVHKQPNPTPQHNPKPQNLHHKSMRPWQHLRKAATATATS